MTHTLALIVLILIPVRYVWVIGVEWGKPKPEWTPEKRARALVGFVELISVLTLAVYSL